MITPSLAALLVQIVISTSAFVKCPLALLDLRLLIIVTIMK